MKPSKIGTPSPALVVAILALVVAIGGTAYATTKLGSSDLKQFRANFNDKEVAPGKQVTVAAKCKKGQRLISGGFDTEPGPGFEVYSAVPFGKTEPRKFSVAGRNTGQESSVVTAVAVCLKK